MKSVRAVAEPGEGSEPPGGGGFLSGPARKRRTGLTDDVAVLLLPSCCALRSC